MNKSNNQDVLNQAYICNNEQTHYFEFTCAEQSCLDIDNYFLEMTQPSEPASPAFSDLNLYPTEKMMQCEHYAVNRHFYVINNSREFVQPIESPNQCSHHYTAVKNYSDESLNISFLLFATQNLETSNHVENAPVRATTDKAVSKPSKSKKKSANLGSKLKKLVTGFTKKLRSKKASNKHELSPIENVRKQTHNRAFEIQAGQFSSNNYDLDFMFASNSSEFNTLGDFVTYFV
jgi:hypothetical protein